MTDTKKKNIRLGALLSALLLLGTLLAGAFLLLPERAEAAGSASVVIGLGDIGKNPQAMTSEQGTYYIPSAYIYYGKDGDGNAILWRVLDAERDNNGEEGAMLLLSEYVNYSSAFQWSSSYGYLDNSTYQGSYMDERVLTGMYPGLTALERAALRPITRTDAGVKADGSRPFGNPLLGYAAEDAELWGEQTTLVNDKIFLPSAEELERYVSTYEGGRGMAAIHSAYGGYYPYFLRTPYKLNVDSVATVSALGEISQIGVAGGTDGRQAYVRPAMNIERDAVIYSHKISWNQWRLILRDELAPDFTVRVSAVDHAKRSLTVSYENAPTSNFSSDKQHYISVIVTDKDGVEKYYGTLGTTKDSYGNSETVSGSLTFDYYGKYDPTAGDKLYVFREYKYTDEAIRSDYSRSYETTTASDLIELCPHLEVRTAPTCASGAICDVCGAEFGAPDPEAHIVSATVQNGAEHPNSHWYLCERSDCGKIALLEHCSGAEGVTCSASGICSVCRASYFEENVHSFDANGICTNPTDPSVVHYEPPQEADRKNTYLIYKPGQLAALAELVNARGVDPLEGFRSGSDVTYEPLTVYLMADIDLSVIPNWVPIGTESSPFFGGFYGDNHRITGLRMENADTLGGLFGAVSGYYVESEEDTYTVKNTRLDQVAVVDFSLSGAGTVGGIVGSSAGYVELENCYARGTLTSSGISGAIVGDGGVFIYTSIAYVKDSAGTPVTMTGGSGWVSPYSYHLASEESQHGRTAEQFASGELAYGLSGTGWGQLLSEEQGILSDPTPLYGGPAVYRVLFCDGRSPRYRNVSENYRHTGGEPTCSRQAVCEACGNGYGDTLPHELTEFIGFGDYSIDGARAECLYRAICGVCGEEGSASAVTRASFYMTEHAGIVRSVYEAYVWVGGELHRKEPVTFINESNRLEDMTVIEPVKVDFDGYGVYARDLVTNTRLEQSEYTAYFIDAKTGERLNHYAVRAGTYHLQLDVELTVSITTDGNPGWKETETLSCIYENVLTIEPITLGVTVSIPDRLWDGTTAVHAFEISFTRELAGTEWLVPKASFPSADVGEYELLLTWSFNDHFWDVDDYRSSVTVAAINTSAKARILERAVLVENRKEGGYPTSLTYGDPVPAPTPGNFVYDAGSSLSFAWYSAVPKFGDYGDSDGVEAGIRIDTPVNAGTYILRVTASATEKREGSVTDFEIKILPRPLTVTLIGETKEADYYGDPIKWLLLDPGKLPRVEVEGFIGGDTAESLGYEIEWTYTDLNGHRYYSGYPILPGEYRLEVRLRISGIPGGVPNYSCEFARVYTLIEEPTSAAYPIDGTLVYTGELLTPEICAPEGWILGTDYTVSTLNAAGEPAELRAVGTYTVTVTATASGISKSATVKVLPVTELLIRLKEISVNAGERIPYDRRNIVIESGLLALGHVIVDIKFHYYEVSGTYEISSWTIGTVDADGNLLEDFSECYILEEANYNVHVHVYSNACDAVCDVRGCGNVRVPAPHSGGKATCLELATCESCGKLYGDYDYSSHVGRETAYRQSADADKHELYHLCCGYAEPAEVHTESSKATCTARAHCDVCGLDYGETDPDAHTSARLVGRVNAEDPSLHDIVHECCGRIVRTESHAGGIANCTSGAICAGCGAAYGNPNPDRHASDAYNYTQSEGDPNRHDVTHACCGVYVTSEAHSGGIATCAAKAICTFCAEGYGTVDPDNHASDAYSYSGSESYHVKHHACCGVYADLNADGSPKREAHSGGHATCIDRAACETCGLPYGALDPENHASDAFHYVLNADDLGKHDSSRACCGVYVATEEHSGGSATCTSLAACAHCGTEYGTLAEHTYDNACDSECNVCAANTYPTFHEDKNGDDRCDHCKVSLPKQGMTGGAIAGIALGSATAAGAGGFSLFWFVIKKKKLADLLGLFI